MIVIVGVLIVFGCVIAGFMLSGGHVGALIHPAELLTIGGAALGAMVMMSPKKVLGDLARGIIAAIKGSPYDRAAYRDLFMLSYDLLRTARKDGLLVLERHVNDPHESEIFKRYPKVSGNHHAVGFLCDGLAPLIDGSTTADQISVLLEAELKVIEEEHHAPIGVLSKTADALPGFGIVAAVLGIVITMGAIDGPVEEVGHKVGAALVGTFLGILLSYGLFGPLATRMEFVGAAEMAYFRTMTSIILACANAEPPKIAIEQARRGVGTEFRPDRAEMEAMFRSIDSAAA